jgi:hypothetical protein
MDHSLKAQRLDSVQNSLDSVEELRRRLPEVDAIYNEEVREATIDYFLSCAPDYFWERPASSTGKYHPPDESGEYGTWLHTKRVFFEYASLSESLLEQHEITEFQRAAGKAAALIHDSFNYGWPSMQNEHTDSSHDVIAAAVVAHMTDLPEETAHLVHSHMGPYGSGKLPETKNEQCFHFADKSAAATNHTQAVYFPCQELSSIETVTEVSVEDDEVV